MKLRRLACVLAALACVASSASATQIANGAHVSTYVRDCRTAAERLAGTPTPSLCDDNLGSFAHTLVDMRYDSNYGGLTAHAGTLDPLATNSRGSVDASGTPGTLILRQATFQHQQLFARLEPGRSDAKLHLGRHRPGHPHHRSTTSTLPAPTSAARPTSSPP
ncbi:hypothetical protein LP419_05175 [Massilia sp. H-1]|nr:hypothetical protein LP419_05175 [Massilia sp. H-1]